MVKRQHNLQGWLFVSPWLAGFFVFTLYPILASLYYSFCDYSVLRPPVYIGLTNYRDLWNDEVFWIALGNTAIYALFALPLGTLMALTLALLLNTKVRGMTIYRTIFFVPSLVPMVALAVLWQWIFNGQYGVLNDLLAKVGVKGPNWLGDPAWAKWALIVLAVWGVGHAMVIYLAGLQDAPEELYEAAELDGAGWWSRTRNVTLPMLSPVILFNVIMGIIGTLQVFTVPYVISPAGSPARSIYFYSMYLFDNAFIYHKMGYACAMGWIMFLAIFLVSRAYADGPQPAPASQVENQVCLACHSNRDATMKLPSGETLSIYTDAAQYNASVHGKQGQRCTTCHANITGYPHPATSARDRRDFALQMYTVCKQCHEKVYQQAIDSIHSKDIAAGNRNAAVCTDCHTAHYVTNPHNPRCGFRKPAASVTAQFSINTNRPSTARRSSINRIPTCQRA